MTTKKLFKDMEVTESIYVSKYDTLALVTRINFRKNGVEIGFATLVPHGDLYCNVEFLPLAIEYITNHIKHINWRWVRSCS